MNQIKMTPKVKAAILTLSASIRGQKGGLARTARKAATSAANGKLSGGRPRKVA